jgi:hypothetical protein
MTKYIEANTYPSTDKPLSDGTRFKAIAGRERDQQLIYKQSAPLFLEFSSSSSIRETYAALKMGTQSNNDLEQESIPVTHGEAAVGARPQQARKFSDATRDQDLLQGLACPIFRSSTAKANPDALTNHFCTTPRPMEEFCRGSAAPDVALGGRCNLGGHCNSTKAGSKGMGASDDSFISGVSLLNNVPADLNRLSWLEQGEVKGITRPETDISQPFRIVVSQMPVISAPEGGEKEEEAAALLHYLSMPTLFTSSRVLLNSSDRRHRSRRQRPHAKHIMRRQLQPSA